MPDPESSARASLRRSMVIYITLLAIDVLAVYYIIANAASGAAYVTLSIVGAVGLLVAFQVWMHLRDLGSPLAETEGVVRRKWTRADLIIAWHSYYMTVGRTVFRVAPEDHIMVDEGMVVKVVHFPRTLNVVSVHEVPAPCGRIRRQRGAAAAEQGRLRTQGS